MNSGEKVEPSDDDGTIGTLTATVSPLVGTIITDTITCDIDSEKFMGHDRSLDSCSHESWQVVKAICVSDIDVSLV